MLQGELAQKPSHARILMAKRADPKPRTLTGKLKPNETPDEATAALMVEGLGMNALAALQWSGNLGELDLSACFEALTKQAEHAAAGDLRHIEATLAGQMVALNAIFTRCTVMAAGTTNLDHIERLMRLAFRAQGHGRATAETMAVLKNPPVFARQANIAHGPQQVNNGALPPLPVAKVSRARVATSDPRKSKLLEAHGERLDGVTTRATAAGDSALEAVGAVNRAADGCREG